MTQPTHNPRQHRTADDGFMLLAAIFMVFLVLLALAVAAPRIATSLKRDREVEAAHRAQQYQRAIRVYYRKFGHYPTSVDQLVSTNNQKFLRQKYVDPLTGKDDWRLIHVGENKTTVKGFFGEDLPGIGGTGIGSGIGGTQTTGGTTSTSAFGGSSSGGLGGTSAFGGSSATSTTGSSTTGSSSNGSAGFGSSTAGSNGTSALGGGGGPIMGVGSSATGDSIVVVNEQTDYQDWEFLYDPRIEQLYAKGNLLGGISSGTGGTGGLGTPPPGFGPGTNGPGTGTNTPATPATPPQ